MAEVFAKYPTASWRVGDGEPLFFPVTSITETGGNRIIPQERPFRDGAKLDDTGSKPRQWAFGAIFNNSLQEAVQNGVPLYPQRLRQLLRSFDVHETGVLVLPTIGKVRARAQDYTRTEAPEEQDTGRLDLVFVEDNEDALDRAALSPPAVVSTLLKLSEQTQFTAQSQGVWNEDLKSLRQIASEIQGLMLAPGRSVSDLGTVVRAHRRALQSVLSTASDESGLGDPRGSELNRQINILLDREAQAEDERSSSRPRTKGFVIDVEVTSIFEVAARLGQDATELLELNSARVDDPFLLTRGEVIRVFESAPR